MVQVGALEVQNVKRAINRYGTLPKGARIGAYLESLRQSGMPSNQESTTVASSMTSGTVEQHEASIDNSQHRSLSPRQSNLRSQPQMTRSNSSSGVVNTYQPPNSPRGRVVAVRKSNQSDAVGLRTFRVSSNSNFRTASPSRSVQPSLADLEFPPPPTDLPPPPDEIFSGQEQTELPPPISCSEISQIRNSPLSIRKAKSTDWRSKEDENEQQEDRNDVSNAEPSVKEACSRFGVNLRRREIQDNSCKTTDNKRTGFKSRIETIEPAAPPEEAPPPPPPPPPPVSTCAPPDSFERKPGMKEMLELKLINEIKQSAETKHGTVGKKVGITSSTPSALLDPASQLLSELCASFNMDSGQR